MFLHDLRDSQQGEIHSFVMDPLFAQQVDQGNHHCVAEQDKYAPGNERTGPVMPGDVFYQLKPAHFPASHKAVVQPLNRPFAGIEPGGKQGLQDLLPVIFSRGKLEGNGQIDEKGAAESGIGNA